MRLPAARDASRVAAADLGRPDQSAPPPVRRARAADADLTADLTADSAAFGGIRRHGATLGGSPGAVLISRSGVAYGA
jgi:hypothetical protein